MSKHDQIAHSLTHDILQGQYRPGERLPSERDLAARFDANRGAVREAMAVLNIERQFDWINPLPEQADD